MDDIESAKRERRDRGFCTTSHNLCMTSLNQAESLTKRHSTG
jgi:hypothetical protein